MNQGNHVAGDTYIDMFDGGKEEELICYNCRKEFEDDELFHVKPFSFQGYNPRVCSDCLDKLHQI